MKILALTLISVFTFISCESIDIKKDLEEVDQTPVIQAALQGSYTQCIPAVLYPGNYAQYTVTISGDNILTSRKLSPNVDCSSPYYDLIEEMKLVKAKFTDSSEAAIDVDVSMIQYKEAYILPWYVSQNYCGYTDWVAGVEKDLTGVSCPALLALYDSFHSSFKAVGEMSYLRYNVTSTTLSYPVGFEQSGDNASERKTTKLATILKI